MIGLLFRIIVVGTKRLGLFQHLRNGWLSVGGQAHLEFCRGLFFVGDDHFGRRLCHALFARMDKQMMLAP
jgi:hypothetical protein